MPKKTRKYPSEKKTTTPNGYREYKKLQMREYRARKKYEAEKSEIEAFMKAFGPFKSDFEKMCETILNSDKPLPTINTFLKEKLRFQNQLSKDFDDNRIKYELLKKTDPIEAAKLLVHIEDLLRKTELTKMEIVTLGFFAQLLLKPTMKEELVKRV